MWYVISKSLFYDTLKVRFSCRNLNQFIRPLLCQTKDDKLVIFFMLISYTGFNFNGFITIICQINSIIPLPLIKELLSTGRENVTDLELISSEVNLVFTQYLFLLSSNVFHKYLACSVTS